MTVAKKTQKGCVSNASDIDLDKIKQDKAMEKAIKLAIDRDELMVYYQPIFSVKKNVYNSAEALVRIHDEELGWISPEEFIPIAEKNGLIIEMGERILTKVCRFIRDFHLSETTVEYIEVNISPVQLNQLGFADRVKHILEEYDVNPEQINIEITETATINAGAMVNDNISSLLDYGISFSLDDYGSGNANISYINHMPFKIIKIDKFIIWDSFKNEKAGITLEYTIGMLNALNLYIVAEGIETEEMQQCLEKFGCHYMQGWYYSKAIPEQEFAALVCG
jgi:EAL domain-containing protein (putative c-di-GMP-specific phosphodiesterase class I)